MRPFLKWPGGKFRLLSALLPHLPPNAQLVEPFAGAGAVFLNAPTQKMLINDINIDLITLYQQLQQAGEAFILEAAKLFTPNNNNAKKYYHYRSQFNASRDPVERSLLFLYLNRFGYNGLCRYNRKGYYNVPFGAYHAPYFPLKELRAFCERSANMTFYCQDYASLLKRLLRRKTLNKMVFYCDPPYAPLSNTANFTQYASATFSLDDQAKLGSLARALARKGATVLLSNHDTPYIREIYAGAQLKTLLVRRNISCLGAHRGVVKEILAVY